VNLVFGVLCTVSGAWTQMTVPIGTTISYCAGVTSVVGAFFVFIGLIKGELGNE